MKQLLSRLRTRTAPQQPAVEPPPALIEYYEPALGVGLASYIAAGDMQGIHHVARYLWAREVLAKISPRNLLDIACGSGFGSHILANHLPDSEVTGADYDARAVAAARAKYCRDNLTYQRGDMVAWRLWENDTERTLGDYDAIVSFETIEHLSHPEIALIRITQHLHSDGVLLLSTPCGHPETNLHPTWEAHKVEYSFSDLQNLLRRFFHQVLLPEDGTLPNLQFWQTQVNKDTKWYLNVTNPVFCARPIKL